MESTILFSTIICIIDYIKWKNQSKYWRYLEAVSMFVSLFGVYRHHIWLKYCRYGVKHSINQWLGFTIPLENFLLIYENIYEGLQILTSARHSWLLSSEGSFACHTYCDTGHPIIMVISENPWHSQLLPNVWLWSCHYLYLRLRSIASMLVNIKCKIANDLKSYRNFQHYSSQLLIIIIYPSKLLQKKLTKNTKDKKFTGSKLSY